MHIKYGPLAAGLKAFSPAALWNDLKREIYIHKRLSQYQSFVLDDADDNDNNNDNNNNNNYNNNITIIIIIIIIIIPRDEWIVENTSDAWKHSVSGIA